MNRREAIASGAAALAIAIPASASPAPVDRCEWEVAMAGLAKVKAEEALFDPIWHDTYARCKAACEAVPHVTLGPDPYTGRTAPVSTAESQYVAYARKMVEDLSAGRRRHDPIPELQAHERFCRKLAAAADERDRQVQAVRDRYNMDVLDQRAEDLGETLSLAQSRLMDTPAPDLAALRWKMEHIIAEEGSNGVPPWSAEYVAVALADVRRLLPEAT